MVSIKEARATLRAAKKQYTKTMQALANQIRRENVIPYCNRTGSEFISGNGTWAFFDRTGKLVINLPKQLENLLQTEVENCRSPTGHFAGIVRCIELGTMMADYTSTKGESSCHPILK